MGGGSPALGVGSTAGAAAGFAVVPVAAQVHLDGQGTVGSCLVLAAVVWGTENTGHGREQKKALIPPCQIFSQSPERPACHIVSH